MPDGLSQPFSGNKAPPTAYRPKAKGRWYDSRWLAFTGVGSETWAAQENVFSQAPFGDLHVSFTIIFPRFLPAKRPRKASTA